MICDVGIPAWFFDTTFTGRPLACIVPCWK